jgi:hypothetical protein
MASDLMDHVAPKASSIPGGEIGGYQSYGIVDVA